jgi:hypothetical protein
LSPDGPGDLSAANMPEAAADRQYVPAKTAATKFFWTPFDRFAILRRISFPIEDKINHRLSQFYQ